MSRPETDQKTTSRPKDIHLLIPPGLAVEMDAVIQRKYKNYPDFILEAIREKLERMNPRRDYFST